MAAKSKATMTVELHGLEAVRRKLNRLSQTVRGKILRKAITKTVQPITKDAKQTAPVDQGWLKRSIGYRIQTYRSSGVVVGVIGPRTGYTKTRKRGRRLTAYGKKLRAGTWQRPTYYAHLVEFGTYRTRANPFIQRAWRRGLARAERTLAQEVEQGIRSLT